MILQAGHGDRHVCAQNRAENQDDSCAPRHLVRTRGPRAPGLATRVSSDTRAIDTSPDWNTDSTGRTQLTTVGSENTFSDKTSMLQSSHGDQGEDRWTD